MIRKHRKILITGCGRSGTSYTSKIFEEIGLDVGHEIDGEDGIVSWLMAVDNPSPPFGPPRNEYEFDFIFHQVRNPIKVISSCQTITEKSWNYILKHIPEIKENDSLLVKCAKYWYYWNLKAEKQSSVTYKIEDFENIFPKILDIIGIKNRNFQRALVYPKNVNSRSYKEIKFSNIKKENEDLYEKIISLAIRYGYSKSNLDLNNCNMYNK